MFEHKLFSLNRCADRNDLADSSARLAYCGSHWVCCCARGRRTSSVFIRVSRFVMNSHSLRLGVIPVALLAYACSASTAAPGAGAGVGGQNGTVVVGGGSTSTASGSGGTSSIVLSNGQGGSSGGTGGGCS